METGIPSVPTTDWNERIDDPKSEEVFPLVTVPYGDAGGDMVR